METSPAVVNEIVGLPSKAVQFTKVVNTKISIAQSPKECVWTLNKAKLWRFVPVLPPEKRHPVPLIMVFAIMNKPQILDLRPGNSFVEFMLQQGYDLYLLDWGEPGPEDNYMKYDDYVLDYMTRAIRKMKKVSGSEEFSMLGWCIGAILATSYAALRPDDGLRNLILLTAPLDFGNKEMTFARWIRPGCFDVDKVLDTFGNMMPADMINAGAKALKPIENYVVNYLKLWDNLDKPRTVEAWQAMNTWVTDNIPMAGGAFRQLIEDLYRGNKLINNEWMLRGELVYLPNIRANLLTVIAEADHITPPCQSRSIMDKVSSKDKELWNIPGGHIGIMAGSTAHRTTWPHIEAWLRARSK